jgi:hypothetical protein
MASSATLRRTRPIVAVSLSTAALVARARLAGMAAFSHGGLQTSTKAAGLWVSGRGGHYTRDATGRSRSQRLFSGGASIAGVNARLSCLCGRRKGTGCDLEPRPAEAGGIAQSSGLVLTR